MKFLHIINKKLLILAGAVIILGIILFIFPKISQIQTERSPIKDISVINTKTYGQDKKIKASDFSVYYIHANGKKTKADASLLKLSKKRPEKTGKVTPVTVKLKAGDKVFKKTVKVKNKRDMVISFRCGSPDLKSVKAVLYSNGELCFEGKGDIRKFNDWPWKAYASDSDVSITSVTFEKGVMPLNMDGWFSDMETLQYVPALPESVQSISGIFSGCSELTTGPDLTKCPNLLNVSNAYDSCISLQKVSSLPGSVKFADSMCYGCVSLSSTPDLSSSSSLTSGENMFAKCDNLVSAIMPPALVNGTGMFSECINLKAMPDMPETLVYMTDMFKENSSMLSMTKIPAKVEDYSSCFDGCVSISGPVTIESKTENWDNAFYGAAVAKTITLQGSSPQIPLIAGEYANCVFSK